MDSQEDAHGWKHQVFSGSKLTSWTNSNNQGSSGALAGCLWQHQCRCQQGMESAGSWVWVWRLEQYLGVEHLHGRDANGLLVLSWRGDHHTFSFIVFQVSLVSPPDWRVAANARIEVHRKSDLKIRVEGGGDDVSGLRVQLTQLSHSFPFGTAVR